MLPLIALLLLVLSVISIGFLLESAARGRVAPLVAEVEGFARAVEGHVTEARAVVAAAERDLAAARERVKPAIRAQRAASADSARAQNAAAAARHAASGRSSKAMRELLDRVDDAVRAALEGVDQTRQMVEEVRGLVARADKAAAADLARRTRDEKAAARAARAVAARAEWERRLDAVRRRGGSTTPQAAFGALRSTLDGVSRRNSILCDATMAACALIAGADGTISDAEKERVEMLIETNGVLSLLDSHRLARTFSRFCADIRASEAGRDRARDAVAALRGDSSAGETVLELSHLVARAEGISAAETRVLDELRRTLTA